MWLAVYVPAPSTVVVRGFLVAKAQGRVGDPGKARCMSHETLLFRDKDIHFLGLPRGR